MTKDNIEEDKGLIDWCMDNYINPTKEPFYGEISNYELIHKTREAINNSDDIQIILYNYEVKLCFLSYDDKDIMYCHKDHNNSELQAIESALKFIKKESSE